MRTGTGIPEGKLRSRRERLLEHVTDERPQGYVLFDAQYIRYFTGFILTEYPRDIESLTIGA